MPISKIDAFRVLDKIEKFSDKDDFLLFIISSLKTTKECDYLISLIDKGKLKTDTEVSILVLLIKNERQKSKPDEDYLIKVNKIFRNEEAEKKGEIID